MNIIRKRINGSASRSRTKKMQQSTSFSSSRLGQTRRSCSSSPRLKFVFSSRSGSLSIR